MTPLLATVHVVASGPRARKIELREELAFHLAQEVEERRARRTARRRSAMGRPARPWQ